MKFVHESNFGLERVMMNPHSNGYRPPFFPNGSHPSVNPGMIPAAFNRPPPPFPPLRMGFRPPGHNGFNNGPNHTHVHPNGFHRPNFNHSGHNGFSSPPPPIHGPHLRGPPPRLQALPPPIHSPAPGPQRPFFTPDNIFNPPPNMRLAGQEGFPFSNSSSQHPPQQAPPCGRGGNVGRGRGVGGRGRGGFVNNRPPQGKKKKEKVNKKDLPENNAYFCDTCDRGFKSEEKYQEHVDGHMKCSYQDCPFIAAPKLVQLHIALQHRTGLAKKVWSMESEEDVRKWREERKRKFPTAANIAKKKEDQAQRIARGEVLQTKDFSVMRGGGGRGRGRGRGGRGQWRGQNRRGRGRGGRFHNGFDNSTLEESKDKEDENSDDSDDEAPPSEIAIGHSQSQDEAHEKEGSKLEEAAELKEEAEDEPQQVESALEAGSPNTTSLGLLASYDYSSSDGEDEGKVDRKDGKLQISENLLPDPVTVSEEQFQPSPCKRPRLLPNPFGSQHASSHSASGQTEMPHCTDLDAAKTPKLQPNISPGDKGSNLKSPNKTAEAIGENSKLKVVTSPAILSRDTSKSPSKSKIQSPSKAGATTALSPAAESNGKGLAPSKDNLTEDAESKEKAESETGSKGNKKGERGKQQAKKQAARKSRSNPLTYTLLEKLLAPDIRRERNKILQCVHYIVKNKFFDPVSTSAASSNSTPIKENL